VFWADCAAVTESPETRYAKTADGVHIAFQVEGRAALDLLFVPQGGGHVELDLELPAFSRVFSRLASFSRLIRYNPQGYGLSDPVSLSELPSLEEQASEILTVLDAVGSQRAALVANGAAGLLAIFFAASYPNRTSFLVLVGCYARLARAPDYPFGVPNEVLERAAARVEGGAGPVGEAGLMYIAPNAMRDPGFVEQYRRYTRSMAGPAVHKARSEMLCFGDVRQALSVIQAPTLVVHRTGDQWMRAPYAHYLAENIPDARLVELPGEDNYIFVGDSDAVVDEIEEFLTGTRHPAATDRVLATVLFTDIVSSTERAAELGDADWRRLLDAHDGVVRRQLDRFRGSEINTVGDGFLATFDGPGRAIQCACAIRDAVETLGIRVRAGLHTGEVETRSSDVAGIAVHIAARVSAAAGPGEVLVSGAVPPLVAGSGIQFDDRGEHELKGVPGTWRLFAVET